MRREVILPANETAAPLARTSLSASLPPPDLLERGDDARLAVTELAANRSDTAAWVPTARCAS